MQIYNRQLKVTITNKLNDLQNTTQKIKDPATRIQIALKLSGFSYTARAYERGFQTIHRSGARNPKTGPVNL